MVEVSIQKRKKKIILGVALFCTKTISSWKCLFNIQIMCTNRKFLIIRLVKKHHGILEANNKIKNEILNLLNINFFFYVNLLKIN